MGFFTKKGVISVYNVLKGKIHIMTLKNALSLPPEKRIFEIDSSFFLTGILSQIVLLMFL